jgi:hypothetical protein
MSEDSYIPNVEIGQTVQYFPQGNLKNTPVPGWIVSVQSPGVVELRYMNRIGPLPLVSAVLFWKHPNLATISREHLNMRGLWRFIPSSVKEPPSSNRPTTVTPAKKE